jgi:hypothetical protein
MKLIIPAALILFTTSALADAKPYFKVGAGYKFKETAITWADGNKTQPVSARFELGIEDGPITYGYSHHSQWATGWPVDNGYEYSKHEIFIDYKFDLSGWFN